MKPVRYLSATSDDRSLVSTIMFPKWSISCWGLESKSKLATSWIWLSVRTWVFESHHFSSVILRFTSAPITAFLQISSECWSNTPRLPSCTATSGSSSSFLFAWDRSCWHLPTVASEGLTPTTKGLVRRVPPTISLMSSSLIWTTGGKFSVASWPLVVFPLIHALKSVQWEEITELDEDDVLEEVVRGICGIFRSPFWVIADFGEGEGVRIVVPEKPDWVEGQWFQDTLPRSMIIVIRRDAFWWDDNCPLFLIPLIRKVIFTKGHGEKVDHCSNPFLIIQWPCRFLILRPTTSPEMEWLSYSGIEK